MKNNGVIGQVVGTSNRTAVNWQEAPARWPLLPRLLLLCGSLAGLGAITAFVMV